MCVCVCVCVCVLGAGGVGELLYVTLTPHSASTPWNHSGICPKAFFFSAWSANRDLEEDSWTCASSRRNTAKVRWKYGSLWPPLLSNRWQLPGQSTGVPALFWEDAIAASIPLTAGWGLVNRNPFTTSSCSPHPNTGKFLLLCNVCVGPFRVTGSSNSHWPSSSSLALVRGCSYWHKHWLISQLAGKHIAIFIWIPSILEKELGHSCDQIPEEGGEPGGSFCNLPLTWTRKTKVTLSAAGTQLPFMLPPGPGAASSPALRPFCPDGAPAAWLPTLFKRTFGSLSPSSAGRCAWRGAFEFWECTLALFFSGRLRLWCCAPGSLALRCSFSWRPCESADRALLAPGFPERRTAPRHHPRNRPGRSPEPCQSSSGKLTIELSCHNL